MTLPREIGDAAQNGDRDRVMAWLDAGGSIDDVDSGGYTLLNCCAVGDKVNELIIGDRQVALARHLIALGADVTLVTRSDSGRETVIHEIVRGYGERQSILEILSLLLGAGANVNARDSDGDTPLYLAIMRRVGPSESIITELLRAGASLDACHRNKKSAEDVIQRKERILPEVARNEHWCAIKRLVAGCAKITNFRRPPHAIDAMLSRFPHRSPASANTEATSATHGASTGTF